MGTVEETQTVLDRLAELELPAFDQPAEDLELTQATIEIARLEELWQLNQ
jgi:hypothetical protein